MKGRCRPIPSAERGIGTTQRADPDIAARIFKQAKDVVCGKPISRGVDRFGPCISDLLEAGQFWVANNALAGAHPPLTSTILEHSLVPAPAPIAQSLW